MWSSKVWPLKLAWMPEDIALCICTRGKETAAHTKSHMSVGEPSGFSREIKGVTNASFSMWFATWCCYGPSTPARYICMSSFLSHGRLQFSLTSLWQNLPQLALTPNTWKKQKHFDSSNYSHLPVSLSCSFWLILLSGTWRTWKVFTSSIQHGGLRFVVWLINFWLPVAQNRKSLFGPHIWNSLPQHLIHCLTLSPFKAKLKTFLFSQYFHTN